jgi:prepilin-type N-terminal cleavage/methylation domain-containing protein
MKQTKIHTRFGFTLLEMVTVIVLIGILSALALPRLNRDLKQEAADNILADIRYTQHLALMDNRHKFDNPKWHRRFWHIVFSTCQGTDRFYMIGADDDMSGSTNATFSESEAAYDPANNKPMFWVTGTDCKNGGDGNVSERIFISKKYGITNITPSGGCASIGATKGHIGFDNLGRPHYNFSNVTSSNYNSYMYKDCTFTFTLSTSETFAITIKKETGYAYIVGQPDS